MTAHRKILIVGGGIAGLTLAAGLGQGGHDVEVVELAPGWDILGVGISLTGPSLRALGEIGLLDRCVEAAFGFSRIRVFDAAENAVDDVEMPSLNGPAYPAMVAIGRRALHELLLAAAEDSGARIRLGLTIGSIEQSGDGVDVTFSDGVEARYDLVVGADGFHSGVRRMVFADAPAARPTGLVVWRASMARLPEIDCMRMYYGPRNKAGLNPVLPDEMFLFLVQPVAQGASPARGDWPRVLRDELADHAGVMRQVSGMIDDPERVDRRAMDSLLVPSPWYRGRVLLIGDAVHTTTPHLATGAGIAIEDAVVLAELLNGGASIDQCLDAFMTRRFERCRLVVEISITLGEWEKDTSIPPSRHVELMKKTFASLAAPL